MNKTELMRTLIKDLAENVIFGVTFVKKNGEVRDMTCRMGVKKHLKGGELGYDPVAKGLLSVFDMSAGEYRMINLSTLTELRVGGKVYKFE